MERTHNYYHIYRDFHPVACCCRIRIYQGPNHVPVVIATDLKTNKGVRISHIAECLAAEVIAQHFRNRVAEERPLRWIEHYERDEWELRRRFPEYALVDFSSYKPYWVTERREPRLRIGDPRWTFVPKEMVEEMIGCPLSPAP